MRLPGTRYQEPGWERVRKLLGAVSLTVLQAVQWPRLHSEPMLDWYCEAMAVALQQTAGSARAQAAGNGYGESALDLAQSLVCELRVLPSFWQAFIQTLPVDLSDNAPSWLRKKVNDMYVGLRDRVDADQYQIATGRPCSANKIYTCRMLDTAYHDIVDLLADWQNHVPQLSEILGRELVVQPIETRSVRSAADCDPHWIIRWSAGLHQFGRGVGPLHTQSKRFSSLKNNPETIRRILTEMAEYEAVSQYGIDDWQSDDARFDDWSEDYWRVMNQSEMRESEMRESEMRESDSVRYGVLLPAVDRVFQLGATIDNSDDMNIDEEISENSCFATELSSEFENSSEFALEESGKAADTEENADTEARMIAALQAEGFLDVVIADKTAGKVDVTPLSLTQQMSEAAQALATGLSLPPDYMMMAGASEDRDSLMYRALQHESLPVRLALYSKQLGAWDESYPEAWLDPNTGELPSMKQLAALDQVSLPTLRKRRDLALQRLMTAGGRLAA
jgi:hypothetical protein